MLNLPRFFMLDPGYAPTSISWVTYLYTDAGILLWLCIVAQCFQVKSSIWKAQSQRSQTSVCLRIARESTLECRFPGFTSGILIYSVSGEAN